MDWTPYIVTIVSAIFGTGGVSSFFLAGQKIKHNKELNSVQVGKLRSEFEAGIAQTHLEILKNLREDVLRADKRNDELVQQLHLADMRHDELVALLNIANQRIAKLELCLITNNLQLPQ